MALPNYVKFQRGTLASYNRLSRKDADTLYFIYDADDESRGSLYLGDRLIGGVGGSGGVNNLSELSDVIISAAHTGDFLVLNSDGKWTSVGASDVAQSILDAGGNFVSIDEKEFQFNAVDGKLEIKGYAEASTGMMPVKSVSGIIWQAAPTGLETRVGDLESAMSEAQSDISDLQTGLSGVDSKIATAIAEVNHLTYKVITNLNQATDANVIYLYSNGSSDPSDRYNEYMLIDGSLELLGSFGIDLSGYMTIEDAEAALNSKASASDVTSLQGRVESLESAISGLSGLSTTVNNLSTTVSSLSGRIDTLENGDFVTHTEFNTVVGSLSDLNGVMNNLNSDATITDNIIDIYERLTWQEISE